jgi:hypothetical protein
VEGVCVWRGGMWRGGMWRGGVYVEGGMGCTKM